MDQMNLPCYTAPYLDRILFYTDNRIDRNFTIWDLYTQVGWTQKDIAEKIGCSQSVVNHTLLVLEEIGDFNEIMEYFMIAFDLCDICVEQKLDCDKYVTNILHSLMRHHIKSRRQIINMEPETLERFLSSRCMKRAGNVACDVFREYYASLNQNYIFINKSKMFKDRRKENHG